MTQNELMREVRNILDQVKSAVLATADAEGSPHMRWMSPVMLRGAENILYSVTVPDSPKIAQLKKNPRVEWLIQPLSLVSVITLKGRINIIDNPSLRAQVMEDLARRLTVFWKLSRAPEEYIVLETVIEEALYLKTVEAEYIKIKF